MLSLKRTLVLLAFAIWCGNSFALDNGLAKLPPMGWNSWNAFRTNINEQTFTEIADALINSGLADAGYVYVNIDGGWCGPEANAALTNRFPRGIGYLADYMHQRNLKLGLYTHWRSIGKEERDAKQWAAWKIDLIKNDAYKTPSTDPYWMKMKNALAASGGLSSTAFISAMKIPIPQTSAISRTCGGLPTTFRITTITPRFPKRRNHGLSLHWT